MSGLSFGSRDRQEDCHVCSACLSGEQERMHYMSHAEARTPRRSRQIHRSLDPHCAVGCAGASINPWAYRSYMSHRFPSYGFGAAGGLASVLTRCFHSAGVLELSCGNSAAAITSLRTLAMTANSSAALGFAASSSFANCAVRHSVGGAE